MPELWIRTLGIIVVGSPFMLVLVLGISALLGIVLREGFIKRAAYAATVSALLASVTILVFMLVNGTRHVTIAVGHWLTLPRYHFSVAFVFDRLSVPFAILSIVLSGTIAAFATRYLHRERGYNRFFLLYSVFVLGMVTTALADTIETLFAGWELVGLSSVLLVAFYQERPAPARNGLRVWITYRVSDAALLLAAVVLHHLTGEGDFENLLGTGAWPEGQASITAMQALIVGLLLLVAAAGKSGLVPFSGWLPRAMEGPTPSSAIFYGALSVHLGAFLLLRVSAILECSAWLCGAVVVLGLATAVHAYHCGRVQTDVKSALSYACLSQVGLIVAEIGLGFRYLVLVHLLGHACLRTLQFVRAPSLLHDYHLLENAIGDHLPSAPEPWSRLAANNYRTWLYLLGLERGYLDSWLDRYVVAPFVRVFRWCDAQERGWTDFLSREPSRQPAAVHRPDPVTIEELA